jgi:hypothetical protein
MSRLGIIALSLLVIIPAAVFAGQVRIFAGARFDAKSWAKLEKTDVKTLSKDGNLDASVGRLVELHFQFRAKELRHIKPNWFQGLVWQASPEGRRGFASVPVMIANTDFKGFEAFTTDHRATADLKVYGQVLYDFGINYVFVRVIGTNTFVDGDGNTNVTW